MDQTVVTKVLTHDAINLESQDNDKKPKSPLLLALPRSKAYPKQTLFGTVLEKVDRDSLKNFEGKYIPEGYIRPTQERFPLPKHLQDALPGKEKLDISRKEIVKQRQLLADVNEQLRAKTENALTFKQNLTSQEATSLVLPERPSWFSEKDLHHSKEINSVGLNGKGSFNRDRYGSKPVTHTYALIGNPLALNMDFKGYTERHDIQDAYKIKPTQWGTGRHLPYDLMMQANASGNPHPQSIIDLPPNIRHKFRSRECDLLLSDENLVRVSLEKQKLSSGPVRPSKKENVQSLPVDLEGNYEGLGHMTRYNVCPGVTADHKISNTKQDFNDLVHLRRVPNTDEFRYQRDELSTWAEHNVLRDRMKKAWNDKYPLGGKT
ncbi:unnamed protein product [Lymnaea stagnalis]|uniref:Uncharacterized protein n=1 Tax=Lymnaea stagnalis TaxID=6523 RepID=A0AAV2HXD5_LYMST